MKEIGVRVARRFYCSAITSTNTSGSLPLLAMPCDSPLRTIMMSPA